MTARPCLRELQRSFADALMARGDAVTVCIDGAGLDPSARLRIYRHSVAGTQIAALRDSYPTVRALVGDEFFEVLANRYRVQYPSTCGNLQQFGSAMAEFVADMPEVEHLHYLADVARLEWLRQCAALAADAQLVGPTASAKAVAVPPERLRIRLHPSLHLLHSECAVLSVFRWCQSPSDPAPRPGPMGALNMCCCGATAERSPWRRSNRRPTAASKPWAPRVMSQPPGQRQPPSTRISI